MRPGGGRPAVFACNRVPGAAAPALRSGHPPMIRWRASTQLTYSGEQFADIFRATAQWSQRSHIPVDVVAAQEAVDHGAGGLHYDLEVLLALQTGGSRELGHLAAHLVSVLDAGWTVAQDGDRLRCEYDVRRTVADAADGRGRPH